MLGVLKESTKPVRSTQFILFFSYIWANTLGSANLAQLKPDNSLGNESSTVRSVVTIGQDEVIDLIEGGADRQKTLFHSFQEFNVPLDRQVYFANPNGIDQIVTRVTGENVSNILGRLGVNGNADLFLLNPNGILFGEDAALDVTGSLLGTTADRFIFSDNVTYGATELEIPPMLRIKIPQGVQFNNNAGNIEIEGTGHQLNFNSSTLMPTGYGSHSAGLQVASEKTLALIGNELNLNGGNLATSGGTIELAAIAQSGRVDLERDGKAWKFDYDSISNYGDINLNSESSLSLDFDRKSGVINLVGDNIALNGGSSIIARKTKSSKTGAVNIFASDSLNIINNASNTFPSGIFSLAEGTANQRSADINIEATNLNLENNALIVSTTTSKADGGNINVDVRQIDLIDTKELPYNAGIYSQALSGDRGDVGIITIELDDLKLFKGQTFSRVDDDDDLEDIIGEDRAEDLEDFIDDDDDDKNKNVIIGPIQSGERTLILQNGGQITSRNQGRGKAGLAIIVSDTIQLLNPTTVNIPEPETPQPDSEPPEPETPQPESEPPKPETPQPDSEPPQPETPQPDSETPQPESEPPEPETPQPDSEPPEPEPLQPDSEPPEPETPENEPRINLDLSTEKIYVVELDNGKNLIVDAEDLNQAVVSGSTVDLADGESESIAVAINDILVDRAFDPNFDLTSACRIGNSNFISVGRGGVPQNPLENISQQVTIPDLNIKLSQQSKTTHLKTIERLANAVASSIVEAYDWKINQAGNVELVATAADSLNFGRNLPYCRLDDN